MTNDQTSRTRSDAPKTELTEQQLNIVSGGVVSPRDPASGLVAEARMHRMLTALE